MTEYQRITERERQTMRRVKIGFWVAVLALVACDVIVYVVEYMR